MKDIDIRKSFIARFKTLPSKYFTTNYGNVNENNNKSFTIPASKQFFNLTLMCNAPSQIGVISDGSQERITGIFQIDVCVPLNVGMDGVDATAKDIFNKFKVGTTFGDVTVTGVYNATSSVEDTYYRQVIRVEFDADIINE